jgi:hypothetical protein
MTLVTRAIISLLAGVGAALIVFWSTWESLTLLDQNPGVGWDAALLASIFLPFVTGTLLVFQTVSRSAAAVKADG